MGKHIDDEITYDRLTTQTEIDNNTSNTYHLYCGRLGHLYMGSVCSARTISAIAPYWDRTKNEKTFTKISLNVHPDCNSKPIV